MLKLYYTQNIIFDMTDWSKEPISQIFAGTNCIMVITSNGRVLQKIIKQEFAARTEYWQNIHQIAISKWADGLSIGLVNDGTCMIAKRPVRYLTNSMNFSGCLSFDEVNSIICSWTNIVQVAVSDTFFALDAFGKVHYAPLSRFSRDEYKAVSTWSNIRRIVTGLCDSVFGITNDGKVVCAGANLTHGPHGDLSSKLSEIKNVVDVYSTGSECEDVVFAFQNREIRSLSPHGICAKTCSDYHNEEKILDGHFGYMVYYKNQNGRITELYSGEEVSFTKTMRLLGLYRNGNNPLNLSNIASFAVGDGAKGGPFIIALSKDSDFC